MPVGFLNKTQQAQLSSFPDTINYNDLITYFTLTNQARRSVPLRSSATNRLCFAIQHCALRFMGFFIKDMAGVPRIIIEFLKDQLDLNEAPDLSGYESLQPYLMQGQKDSLDQLLRIEYDQFTGLNWLSRKATSHSPESILEVLQRIPTLGVRPLDPTFRSTWFAEGGYEPIAEVLFNELNVDAYFLEYDDERSGDFAPLRFVPNDKTVVLGLVTTKLPEMELSRDLIQRIKEAAQYLPLENMCLSPQCGFSSTFHGNQISEDEQWAKLELVVKTSLEIWGDS